MGAWQARHGLTSQQYQDEFNRLVSQGYRLVDVSGYDEGGQARYAAIWEQAPGPAWEARHGLTAAQYQATFDSLVAQGYRLAHVAGYSVQGVDQYAAIWDRSPGPDWQARHGMTPEQYQARFDSLVAEGYRLVRVSGYEVDGGDRYAALWIKATGAQWQARHGLTAAQYQATFDSLVSQGYRLLRVSGYPLRSEVRYAAIWEQSPGAPWVARHGLSPASYQAVFDDFVYQGYRLVSVDGYRSGAGAALAACWENRGFKTDELAAMNKVVTDFMAVWGAPGASVAITKDGRLVYAKGFGSANTSSQEAVTVHHRFRIASVSKPMTSATLMRLHDLGMVSISDHVFGAGARLGTTYGTQPYGVNIDQITVQNLLEHTGGAWPNDGTDPMFAQSAMNHAQLISWVLDNHPLTSVPGTHFAYSNFGYCVLGRVVEQVTGMPYATAVQHFILAPAGISGMSIGGNTLADRQPLEVTYYGQGGEDPYNLQVQRMDSHGGWIATPIDLMRFAVRIDAFSTKADLLTPASIATMTTPSTTNTNYAKGWAVNGAPNWWHNGNLPGTSSILVRTASGFCWAALVNTRRAGIDGALDSMMWNIIGKVTLWPGHDLF
jgi:CubicO group peptidase (beta-lactamase class C family)